MCSWSVGARALEPGAELAIVSVRVCSQPTKGAGIGVGKRDRKGNPQCVIGRRKREKWSLSGVREVE